jgi:hypothetical protein
MKSVTFTQEQVLNGCVAWDFMAEDECHGDIQYHATTYIHGLKIYIKLGVRDRMRVETRPVDEL